MKVSGLFGLSPVGIAKVQLGRVGLDPLTGNGGAEPRLTILGVVGG